MKLLQSKPFSEGKSSRQEAKIIITGAGLDSTSSFRPGTRFAPSQIREYSWHLEDYDFKGSRNITEYSFFDAGDLLLEGDIENCLQQIGNYTLTTLEEGKKPLLIGGEHLISYPVVKSCLKRYKNLHIFIFDAHTDLMGSYRNLALSHGCVTKLIYEAAGSGKIFLFGVRSGSKQDMELLDEGKIFCSHEPPDAELIKTISSYPVYISIDVDVLDPSVAPGVGCPELCGWSYQRLVECFSKLEEIDNIVGADVVEICPPFDPSGITSLIGAEIVRNLIYLMDKK